MQKPEDVETEPGELQGGDGASMGTNDAASSDREMESLAALRETHSSAAREEDEPDHGLDEDE